jgi:hypothetical protein
MKPLFTCFVAVLVT